MITVRGGGFNVSSTAVLQLTNNSLQVQATASPVSMSQCNDDLSLSLSSRLADVRPLDYKLSPDIPVLSQLQQFTRVTSCQCSGCS